MGFRKTNEFPYWEALVLDDFFGSPFSCTPKWDRDRPSTPWYQKMDGGLAMHKIGMICNSFTMGCCTRIPKRTSPSVVPRDLNSDPNPAAPPSQPREIHAQLSIHAQQSEVLRMAPSERPSKIMVGQLGVPWITDYESPLTQYIIIIIIIIIIISSYDNPMNMNVNDNPIILIPNTPKARTQAGTEVKDEGTGKAVSAGYLAKTEIRNTKRMAKQPMAYHLVN